MTAVMKVSKPTYNALTTSNENLSFSSELATHCIYNILTVSRPAGGASSITIAHNLGYVPKVWAYWSDVNYLDEEYFRRLPKATYTSGDSIDYYIDSTNVVIEFEHTDIAHTIKVIIFTRSTTV